MICKTVLIFLASAIATCQARKVSEELKQAVEVMVNNLTPENGTLFNQTTIEQIFIGPIAPGMVYFSNNTISPFSIMSRIFDMSRNVKNRLILSFENRLPIILYSDASFLWLREPFYNFSSTLTFNRIMYRFAIDFDCDHQSYIIQPLEGVYMSAPSVDFRPKGPENGEKSMADALTQAAGSFVAN